MACVLVVAPHPDDETLGCGGTLLRHAAEGDGVHWLVVAEASLDDGLSADEVRRLGAQVEAVAAGFGFRSVHRLRLGDARLDALPSAELRRRLGAVLEAVSPEVLYLPFRGDAHSDHRCVFDAVAEATGEFRSAALRRVLVYETPSETDFCIDPAHPPFRPDVFVDVSEFLERKLELMGLYRSEIGPHPFPRSEEGVRALATVRGASAGCRFAEAFALIKELR